MCLENLGASERLRQLIHPFAQQGLELGRVCFASHEHYGIYVESANMKPRLPVDCAGTTLFPPLEIGWPPEKLIGRLP